jgi:acyl-coenzyme A thioesterase PaaI-like protein
METLVATASKKESSQRVIALNTAQKERLASFNSPLKMWFWELTTLPAAWFMGVRVKSITPERAEITLPYGWRSQNPFNSIYFAAQAAAAEMSTGLLATLALAGRGKISMLVSHFESQFTKKATSKTTFVCEQGAEVFATIERAIATGEAQTIVMTSVGTQATGEVVSITKVTWIFKAKK